MLAHLNRLLAKFGYVLTPAVAPALPPAVPFPQSPPIPSASFEPHKVGNVVYVNFGRGSGSVPSARDSAAIRLTANELAELEDARRAYGMTEWDADVTARRLLVTTHRNQRNGGELIVYLLDGRTEPYRLRLYHRDA